MMSGTIIAALLWPGLFYAGAASASAPILIHLLSKRRFRRIRWAAVEFLLEADRRNRRRMRIEELILLALRCVAMLIVGLMLARWFLRPEALMAMLGSAGRTERIVLLDDSFSMGLQSRTPDAGAGTVFDRAKTSVERLVRWVREESPNDRLTIILTSSPDTPWRSDIRVADLQVSELNSDLGGLRPTYRGGNVPAVMNAVRSMLDARPASLNANLYIVSDFQSADWGGGRTESGETAGAGRAAGRSSAGPAETLAGWTGKNRSLRVVLVDVGDAEARNLAVTSLDPQAPQVVAGLSARYVARIANFGAVDSEPTALQIFVGDAAQPQISVPPIEPWQSVSVPIEVTFPNEGSETLSAELSADRLPADNTRWLAVPVARAIRLLIVNGEPSPDPYQDETFLLKVALRPEGPQFSGNDVTVVDENELEQTNLAEYQVVMLANVFRMNEEVAGRLEQYAAAGGGVILFLGDQVDPELYNRLLYREGQGLLPARLGDVISPPTERGGVSFGEINRTHPAMRRFSEADVPYFDGVIVSHFVATPLDRATESGTQPAGTATSAPAETSGRDSGRGPAQVMLRYDDVDKNAAIVERPFGNGRAILMTTTVDKEWNNLADRPAYVVLLMEMIQHAARHVSATYNQLVGEPIRLPLDPALYQPSATLKPARYPEEPAVRIDAQAGGDNGRPQLAWSQTDRPGIYRFELTETAGGNAIEHVTVNVDPRESDLRPADRSRLLEAFEGLPVDYVNAEQLGGDQDVAVRRELWPLMLALLVTVLMTEQGLAWWFGTEKRARAQGPAVNPGEAT